MNKANSSIADRGGSAAAGPRRPIMQNEPNFGGSPRRHREPRDDPKRITTAAPTPSSVRSEPLWRGFMRNEANSAGQPRRPRAKRAKQTQSGPLDRAKQTQFDPARGEATGLRGAKCAKRTQSAGGARVYKQSQLAVGGGRQSISGCTNKANLGRGE